MPILMMTMAALAGLLLLAMAVRTARRTPARSSRATDGSGAEASWFGSAAGGSDCSDGGGGGCDGGGGGD